MRVKHGHSIGVAFALIGLVLLIGGLCLGHAFVGMVAAAITFCLCGLFASPLSLTAPGGNPVKCDSNECTEPGGNTVASEEAHVDSEEAEDVDQQPNELVDLMLSQNRYALLLRPQLAANIEVAHRRRAQRALDKAMAIVPQGDVIVKPYAMRDPEHDQRLPIEALYVDRFLVTNRLFKQFVDAGGYEQPALWDPQILPAVLQFVDMTGNVGPEFWRDREYPEGQDEFPVVGISWHEAMAYARWAGKRLPTSAEWLKAGSWPVTSEGSEISQRKYPWGDAMDRQKANLWGSGPEQPCSVKEFSEGVSVGGVYQLVGNVWEWTSTAFAPVDISGERLDLATPMKTIRGGAYDTYFDSQATCQFQSGESPMARKHNIGFRCALSLCDVAEPSIDCPATAPVLEPQAAEMAL